MNIVSKNKPVVLNENEVITAGAQLLVESYERCPNVETFLRENSGLDNADYIFHKLALTESVTNPEKSFMFENGMKIPSIGNKMRSRVTLNGIFESVENESEFVQLVESNIIPVLDFALTESDRTHLIEHYKSNKILV